jgi:hypothetical protein
MTQALDAHMNNKTIKIKKKKKAKKNSFFIGLFIFLGIDEANQTIERFHNTLSNR